MALSAGRVGVDKNNVDRNGNITVTTDIQPVLDALDQLSDNIDDSFDGVNDKLDNITSSLKFDDVIEDISDLSTALTSAKDLIRGDIDTLATSISRLSSKVDTNTQTISSLIMEVTTNGY